MEGNDRKGIVENWLPRYTGMELENFGKLILLTNFYNYLEKFSSRFHVPIYGRGGPMQAATNSKGITMINFGIGSPNAATIMDLLSAIKAEAVLFLGKCGGLKRRVEIGRGKRREISEEEVEKIRQIVTLLDGVLGAHDIIIHSYGKDQFVSMHIDINANETPERAHDIA